MDLMTVLNFANISYKSDIKVGAFLRIKGIDEYLDNDLGEYRYIYFIKENTLYISIRGSYELENWVQDVLTTSIGEGFVKILHHLINQSVLEDANVNKIVITGHSLGGSIAINLGNHIKDIYKNITVDVVAFSPMKPYKNKYKNKANVYYFTVEGDIAPLYPFGWYISGKEIFFNKKGKISKFNKLTKILGVFRGIFNKGYGVIESHKIEILQKNISNNKKKLEVFGLWIW
mgnify:CR=1 FL=1